MIVDNHSAHISKETNVWLAKQPVGRFQFTFTNLIEGFFSKFARSGPRRLPPWITSIRNRSFTPGPTSSTGPRDMIRAMKSMY
jgi:hypothetical protein